MPLHPKSQRLSLRYSVAVERWINLKIVRHFLNYGWSLLGGLVALLLIYFYDGALQLPEWSTKGSLRLAFNLSAWDWYFLLDMLLILPVVRILMRQAFSQESVEFETYKDKALRLHHADVQANHKNRAWSANGVTVNPWEFRYTQTQSYKGAADFGFNIFKNLCLNLLIVLFGPLWLIYALIKRSRHRKSL
ncbi:hypothetical protein FC79_GL002318 [Lentilactobacillus buchneri DSM 20057]|nr:hypothetical protein FC79_GL002318 [Lentilactobacillus buchneri DSM 20057]